MLKISQWGLNVLLAANLNGAPIFEELLSRVTLQKDADGNIPDHQVDNLKTMIKVALRIAAAGDSIISVKLKKALESLLDYGTEESSDNVRAFLESPESKTPLIITEIPVDSDCSKIGEILSPLLSDDDRRISRGDMDAINFILQSTVQDFSVS